jgi:3-oxoacyl-[acyl-carrier protein] reductase
MNLSGKIALVTGAGQGIGRAISLRLSECGAKVVVADVNNAATSVVEEINSLGGVACFVEADVSNSESVEKMVSQAIALYGSVDILVNNAGINRDALILRMNESDWDKVIDVNLKSAFLCSKSVLRSMLRNKWGRIINLSSVVGVMGNLGQANYSASKAGLIGLTKTVSREVGSRNITVNAIAPGFIMTEMTARLPQDVQEKIKSRISMGRFGSAEEIADLVSYLASDRASYITGQTIGIDGGIGL